LVKIPVGHVTGLYIVISVGTDIIIVVGHSTRVDVLVDII
jgi:hypothetical protein